MRIKNSILLLFSLGCMDRDKLVGDSNIYFDVDIESTDEIDLREEVEEPVPNTALGASVVDERIVVEHIMTKVPCGHDWTKISIDLPEEKVISVDYNLDSLEVEGDCLVDLRYSFSFGDVRPQPGVYQLKAHTDVTEMDLTEMLSE